MVNDPLAIHVLNPINEKSYISTSKSGSFKSQCYQPFVGFVLELMVNEPLYMTNIYQKEGFQGPFFSKERSYVVRRQTKN